MVKKIFFAVLFAFLIFFCEQNNFANAQDVYVGTSNTTGRDCYLMTETINSYRKSRHGLNIEATLKMVRKSDGNIQFLYYDFYEGGNHAHFKNSQGFEGFIDEYETPIEWRMYWTIQKYL